MTEVRAEQEEVGGQEDASRGATHVSPQDLDSPRSGSGRPDDHERENVDLEKWQSVIKDLGSIPNDPGPPMVIAWWIVTTTVKDLDVRDGALVVLFSDKHYRDLALRWLPELRQSVRERLGLDDVDLQVFKPPKLRVVREAER